MIRLFKDHWLKLSILSTLLLLIGTGCVADRNRMDCPSDSEEYSVTFNLQVPSMQSSLRSVMTPEEERAIGNINVFVFKQTPAAVSDDSQETLAYIPDFVVTGSELGQSTKDLVVRLQKPDNATTELYRLIFVANRDLQGLVANNTIHEGMTKKELRIALESAYNERWTTKSIPMWGETNLQSFDNRNKYDDFLHPQAPGANSLTRPIHLIRSLARVDVGTTLSYKDPTSQDEEDVQSSGLKDFKIKSVAMYRYATKYSVMAAQTDLQAGTAAGQKPNPTLPSDLALATDDKPLQCELATGGNFIAREIYIPERSAGSSVSDRPCIIIGAYYGAGNTTQVTYYRLDFIQREEATPKDKATPLDILRNHRYGFNITKVLGPGTTTPEEALITEPVNIQCDVTVWDEGGIDAIAYDGQYWLTVSRDKLKALRAGGNVTSEIHTSWPKGFTIESLPDFVRADVTEHPGTDKKVVTFTFDPMGAGFAEGEIRTGGAHVRAGRITWPLHFEQINKEEYSIAIYSDKECTKALQYIQIHQLGTDYNENDPKKRVERDGEILTAEEAHATVTFYVKAKPTDRRPDFITIRSDRFQLSEPTDLGDGVWQYTVTAPGMDPDDEVYFDTRDEAVRFRITTESGKMAEADLTFFQQEYNAIPYYDATLREPFTIGEPRFYILDGEWKNIFVKSNSEYNLKLKGVTSEKVNPADGIVTFSPVTSSSSSLHGHSHPFKTYNDITDPKYYEGTATFEVSSREGLFPTREFTVRLFSAKKQPEANTYLIKKNARQRLLIPLSRINTAAAYYKTLVDADFANPEVDLSGIPSDYYLNTISKDSWVLPKLIWTNMGRPKGRGSIEGSGIKTLQVLNSIDPSNPTQKAKYLLVELDENVPVGEALVGVYDAESNEKPLLWSWLIWVVDDYPKTQEYTGQGRSVTFLDRTIGARKAIPRGEATKEEYKKGDYMGYQFQFGRKDPFPARNLRELTQSGDPSGRLFYDSDGNELDFNNLTRGNRNNALDDANLYYSTYTLRGSIENPANIVAHETVWLYEGFAGPKITDYKKRHRRQLRSFLWSTVFYNAATKSNYWLETKDKKTPFDPSPYGFTVPSVDEMQAGWAGGAHYFVPRAGFIYDGKYTGGTGFAYRNGYMIYSRNFKELWWVAQYVINDGTITYSFSNTFNNTANACTVMPITYPEETNYQSYLPE